MRIMVNGRSLSGKGIVAERIKDKYNFKEISFAKPLYEIARDYFDRDMDYGNNRIDGDRQLIIDIGQNMREIRPTVWIDHALKTIEQSDYPFWVISDVRQSNEYVICKEQGFIPIRVTSTLDNRIKRCEQRDGFTPTEETIQLWKSKGEIGGDDFKYHEISNDGTLEDLYEQIDDVIDIYRNIDRIGERI